VHVQGNGRLCPASAANTIERSQDALRYQAAIGYLLVLASLMRLAALATGWALAAALFGCGHVAIGAWGMARGRTIGTAECYDVVDPITDSDADPRGDAGEAPAGQGALAVRPSDLLDFTRSRLGGGYALLRGGTKFE
jgi:hypothetical protein